MLHFKTNKWVQSSGETFPNDLFPVQVSRDWTSREGAEGNVWASKQHQSSAEVKRESCLFIEEAKCKFSEDKI